MGLPPCFSTILTKGDNFNAYLIAFLDEEMLSKIDLLSMKIICSSRSKLFSLRVDP